MADILVEAEAPDNNFVARISQILNAAGVPNLLWGNYLLTVYGVPTIIDVGLFLVFDAIFTKPMIGRGLRSGR